jgi:microcystin-dependent protein
LSRVKTFDSTGVAPSGRIYAGDLNAIQDHYADIYNLAQACGVVSLAIGEAGLILSRYGAGIAGLSGTFRATAAVNAVGGFQVNGTALASTHLSDSAGLARLTDVAGVMPSGAIVQFAGTAAPAGWLLCQGQSLLRTDYNALFTAIGTTYGAVDGTHFTLPDMRGRVPVGKSAAGTFVNLAATGGEELHTLALSEIPAHSHSGSTSAVGAGTPAGTVAVAGSGILTTGAESSDHTHSGTTAVEGQTHAHSGTTNSESVDHSHYYYRSNFTSLSLGTSSPEPTTVAVSETYVNSMSTDTVSHQHTFVTGTQSANHTHTFTTGGRSAAHTHDLASHTHTASFSGSALGTHSHTISSEGGGTSHNNLQPYLVVNYIIKV